MINCTTCILLVFTLMALDVTGLPQGRMANGTSTNTEGRSSLDMYNLIIRHLEALVELFRGHMSSGLPKSGATPNNNSSIQNGTDPVSKGLSSPTPTDTYVSHSKIHVTQESGSSAMKSEDAVLLSQLENEDGSGDENSLTSESEITTQRIISDGNLTKENVEELLAEEEMFSAMKTSQNPESNAMTTKGTSTGESEYKTNELDVEGATGTEHDGGEGSSQAITQSTKYPEITPITDQYVREHIDDGIISKATKSSPMEKSAGDGPRFVFANSMSPTIAEASDIPFYTSPTLKTTLNEYFQLLLHNNRPTKLPRKVKEETFWTRRCTRPGLYLPHPYSQCMYVRCEFIKQNPIDERASDVQIAPVTLLAQTYLCEQGTAVPTWFFSGVGNPCLLTDPLCE